MRNDQLKQMMFEAKIWFDENKYAEYQEMFETNYNHEVNTWTLFDQYIRDIKDYDIIDMFIFDEEQDGDAQAFRALVSQECDKVIQENIKTIFPTISRVKEAA